MGAAAWTFLLTAADAQTVYKKVDRKIKGHVDIQFRPEKTDVEHEIKAAGAEADNLMQCFKIIKSDSTAVITAVWLKGYASPEGPLAANTRLARERTESLRQFILSHYDIPDSIVNTNFCAEDWVGLRMFVDSTALPHRDAVLALIDTPMDLDAKERQLQHDFPDDYRRIVDDCFPNLRRTEFVIDYTCYDWVEHPNETTPTHAGTRMGSTADGRPVIYYYERVTRQLRGDARITYRLNKTDIDPAYYGNQTELDRINNGIDSIQADTAATVTSIRMKGYASPEGPLRWNTHLATGRAKTLHDYVAQRYPHLADKIVSTYEVEDWAGLRNYVDTAALTHRDEILSLIDADMHPDDKERAIRRRFPADYRRIMREAYPRLRHTDYIIDYNTYDWVQHEMPTIVEPEPEPVDTVVFVEDTPCPPLRLFALKTNLLFDLALAVNAEVEVPLGRTQRWSVMAEWWAPWYIWRHNSCAYEVVTVGLELRHWFERQSCPRSLTGWFAGVYGAYNRYDLEWKSVGDQGWNMWSTGVTAGHTWQIARNLNFELSASVGYYWGHRYHYNGEFNDKHLIWYYDTDLRYFGPTKLKASLVWLLGHKQQKIRKTKEESWQ